MTNSRPPKLRDLLGEEIKYRVIEEYKKYHNDLTFEWNGKDFWIEQIIWKLTETVQQSIKKDLLDLPIMQDEEYYQMINGAKFNIPNPYEIKHRNQFRKEFRQAIIAYCGGEIDG